MVVSQHVCTLLKVFVVQAAHGVFQKMIEPRKHEDDDQAALQEASVFVLL
jgi:hypothetical protein